MKILAPLNEKCQVDELIDCCDEFYFGVRDSIWEKQNNVQYSNYNTRGVSANFSNWEKLQEAIVQAHANHMTCFLTVNSHNIGADSIDNIKNIIRTYQSIGGDGVICSELNGLEYAKSLGLKTCISTNMALYNLDAIEYLCRNYDPDRIILSRDITLEFAAQVAKAFPDKEVEVFGYYFGCRYSNGLCFCTHNHPLGGMCSTENQSRWIYRGMDQPLDRDFRFDLEENKWLYTNYLFENACSVCALYDLMQSGIHSLKIVGRELDQGKIKKAALLLSKYRDLAAACSSKEEYFNQINQDEVKCAHLGCKFGYQCYFPDASNKAFW